METKKMLLSAENAVTKKNLSYSELMNFEDNDFEKAKRFLQFARGEALYDSATSKWFLYGEGRWKPDNERKERVLNLVGTFYSYLNDALKSEYQDLEEYGFDISTGTVRDIDDEDVDNDQLTEIYARVKQCIRERKIISKLGNGHIQRRIIKSAETQLVDENVKLNPYDYYLVVANGTVDLRTGELLNHSRDYYSTMRAPVPYNREAKEPTRFLQFLEEIFNGDTSLINYVHRVLGYCITGETCQHEFYILHGEGGNGKGVLINLLKSILDEYCADTNDGALGRRANNDGPNATIVQAKYSRILFANETEKGAQINTALIKRISAGDEVSERALHKNHDHFIPHMKLLLATNHVPKLDWDDRAIERRARLIPFLVNIPKEKEVLHLDKILLEEREGILKWLVEGAVAYYQEGMLPIPETMRNAMDREKFGDDNVHRFFKKVIVPTGQKKDRWQARKLYAAYTHCCVDEWTDLPKSEKLFSQRLQELIQNTAISKKKCSDGMNYFGLKLLSKHADSKVAAEA